MNEFRVIPILLLSDYGLVKTTKFKDPNYLGDPINALKIFNEKEVDEIILIDIDKSRNNSELDYTWISEIVSESFMPVSFGGNIDSFETAQKLFRLGIEKIILNSNSFNYDLIKKISEVYGNQSVVVSIDYRRNLFGKLNLYIQGGSKKMKIDLSKHLANVIEAGAGEILFHNIDREGSMQGLDIDFVTSIANDIDLPVLISGGCSSHQEIKKLSNSLSVSGVAAGSVFVYKGNQKGILINYEK